MFTAIVIICSLLFIVGYVALIAIYYRAWNAIPAITTSKHMPIMSDSLSLTVIIPARDESESIQDCVRSVLRQECAAKFEVIVVDDHSSDNTAELVEALVRDDVRVIRLAELELKNEEVAYKKRAIETGVAYSRGEVIVTTDADCSHHPKWLESIASAFQSGNVDMTSGPVLFNYNKSLFQRFQAIDFVGMIGITAASLRLGMFNLANGANLAFRKSVFQKVEGYTGIDNKASGDDMLLIYKFAQQAPSRICFLKSREASVYTKPASSLSEFIQQRLRWTSKSFSYQDKRITLILAFVYLANLLFLFLMTCAIFSSSQIFFLLLVSQVVAMFTVDYIFLKRVTGFFGREDLMKAFLPSQLLHIAYIITIGLMGNLVKYRWKGRKLK